MLLSLTWVGGRKGGLSCNRSVRELWTLKWWTSVIFVTAEAGAAWLTGVWALDVAVTSWGPHSPHSALFAQRGSFSRVHLPLPSLHPSMLPETPRC